MGTYIAELQVVVDTSQLEKANKVLSDLNQVAPKVEKTLGGVSESFKDAGAGSDGLTAAQERLIARVEKLSATVGESRAGVLRYDANLLKLGTTLDPLINKFDTLSTAQKSQDAVSKAIVKSQESLSTAQYRMIESLREEIAVFGKSREEVLLYKAGLMGIEAQVSPLITKLNELKAAKVAEAQAGSDTGGERISKREREKAALAAEARQLEDNIRLLRERDRAANESSGISGNSSVGGGVTKEAEAALGRYEQKLNDVRTAQRELDASTSAISSEYASLKNSIDPTSKALDDIVLKQDRLNEIYRSGMLAIPEQEYQRLTNTLVEARNKIEGVGQSTTAAKNDFEQLRGSIDPVTASLAKLDAQQNALNAAFNNPDIKLAQAEYDRLNGIINNSRQRIQDLGAQTGKTSKEINFALRGLPAQFTDIFVSLQGGQAPLTVFLQQGGQLKDMFGGVGPAFKALGGYVLGLVTPFTVLTAAIVGLGAVWYDATTDVSQFNKAIFSSQGVVRQSAQELNSIAEAAGKASGSLGKATDAVLELSKQGGLSSRQIEGLAGAISAISSTSGKSVEDVAQEFKNLGKDVTEATGNIADKFGLITAEQFRAIEAAQKIGNSQQALDILSESLNKAAIERNNRYIESLNGVEYAWERIKKAASETYEATKTALFPDIDKQIENVEKRIAQVKAGGQIGVFQDRGTLVDDLTKELNILKDQRAEKEKEAQITAKADQARATRLEITRTLSAEEIKAQTQVQRLEQERNNLIEKRVALFAVGSQEDGSLDPAQVTRFDDLIAKKNKEIREAEEAARKKTANANKTPAIREDSGTALLNNLKQRESVLRGQLETTTKLGAEEKKLKELGAQFTALEKGSAEGILTIKQKQILAQKDVLLAQQNTNVELEKKKKLLDEELRVKGVMIALDQQLANDQQRYTDALVGTGMSDKALERLRERNKIEQEYQKQLETLGRSRSEGKTDEDTFQRESALYKQSLNDRLAAQQEFYAKEDEARSNWVNGSKKAFANYLEAGRDVAGMTESLFTNSFSSIEDALVGFVTTGKLSFKDLTVSILSDLTKMATRIAANQILMGIIGSLGGGAGAATSATVSSGANFAGYAAKGKAYSGGTQFFAKGGAFTNSVVNKPTAFGTSTGMGVMGEAGPEAILPLTRTSDGQLGVQAAGGMSSSVVAPVNVTVNTDSGGGSATSTDTEAQGRGVQMAIKSECEKAIQNGLRPGGAIWRSLNGR